MQFCKEYKKCRVIYVSKLNKLDEVDKGKIKINEYPILKEFVDVFF